MRDAMKAAIKAGRFKKEIKLDPVTIRLESIRGHLMGGNPLTSLRPEPSSQEIDEIYNRIYGE